MCGTAVCDKVSWALESCGACRHKGQAHLGLPVGIEISDGEPVYHLITLYSALLSSESSVFDGSMSPGNLSPGHMGIHSTAVDVSTTTGSKPIRNYFHSFRAEGSHGWDKSVGWSKGSWES